MKTAIVDDRHRVRIPGLKPGQVLAYEQDDLGIVTLKPVKPVKTVRDRPVKVRFEKRGRYTVGVLDRPINMDALKEALADFPP